ncbi:hypothetical protein [Pedobacter sp. UBA4863]|uniref:hypothetical protein n=1 Tax=Pedobacter sp. UBA4863 TaxID=1947060 RepID=UPI0025E0F423|nr:hypothetical protein [Pedobacter sp. UBA4863]
MKNLKRIYEEKFKQAVLKSDPFDLEKIVHPYQILVSFFDAGNIQSHLIVLKELYKNATRKGSLKKEPHSIMYNHKLFSELLNATWVIYKTKVKRKDIPFHMADVVMPGGALSNCTLQKYLMDDEISNPYLGFYHCYKDFSLSCYQRNLYHWFWFASSTKDFLGKDKDTKKIYRNFYKILICSWSIYKMELLNENKS